MLIGNVFEVTNNLDMESLLARENNLSAVSSYTTALKASVKSQTEFQPKLIASATISNVRTDDIFTNVLIQHGRKALNKEDMGSTRSDQLRYFSHVSGTPVKHCEEIFIDATNDERIPKSILLTGKAGIGKTLFCQKLVRDWADNKLFQSQASLKIPDFKFVYLLTFRQLNLLENNQLSMQELLNCSTVLDDSSDIDDSLFEYIVNHSEEVLIIIDGYDEYSQQDNISGRLEEQYPNNTKKKMPVAALCTKLIKGKLLRDSVVMITSRPEKSNKMTGIPFDLFIEIAGFSPEQVQEYIEKYFRENNTMKNAILDHVLKNENLVSFAHIPMLCFLMCFCMEYALQTSKSTDDLPVSITDIYSEVMNIFELKHDAASEYRAKEIPEEFNPSHEMESTLDKLSELAADLLLKKKPIFEKRDMEKKFLPEEIEKLKGSGLLYCGPPFRTSAIETARYFSFTHLTIQEYLAARWFVMRNAISYGVSEMVLQFMAGILSKRGNGELMEKLLENISFSSSRDGILLRAKCLSEYQDKEFAKYVIKNHPRHYSNFGSLCFTNTNDLDGIAISFLLDVFSALNEEKATTVQHQRSEQFFTVNSLAILGSSLTLSGITRLCKSLEKERCSITRLNLFLVRPLPDKSVDRISGLCSKLTELHISFSFVNMNPDIGTDVTSLCDALKYPSCNVTTLSLRGCITDTGVTSLCVALKHPNCKVTTLDISGNGITDTGVTILCDALKHPICKVTTLYISSNGITDTGVTNLCDALKHPNCKVTTLDIGDNGITDTGVTILCDALKHANCKVTTLDISSNGITDTGVTNLCDALKHPNCIVTTLDISSNGITDTGVTILCDALKHPNCKVTTLNISDNEISDTGVTILSDAWKHANCKVTTLNIRSNEITDTGVTILSDALKHPNCKVTTLNIRSNEITDTGVTILSDALKHPNCKVTTLDIGDNGITDTGVTILCDALKHPNCKVTTLDIGRNEITDTGVTILCDALKHPNCEVTTLDLTSSRITDTGVSSLCEAVQHDNCKLVELYLLLNDISRVSKKSLRNLVEQHRPGFKLSI